MGKVIQFPTPDLTLTTEQVVDIFKKEIDKSNFSEQGLNIFFHELKVLHEAFNESSHLGSFPLPESMQSDEARNTLDDIVSKINSEYGKAINMRLSLAIQSLARVCRLIP